MVIVKMETAHLLREDKVPWNPVNKKVEWFIIQIFEVIRYGFKITMTKNNNKIK